MRNLLSILLITILFLSGCGFALISKADINQFHGDFKVYRKYTEPTQENEQVEQLGDNLEKVLRGWKGESDAK